MTEPTTPKGDTEYVVLRHSPTSPTTRREATMLRWRKRPPPELPVAYVPEVVAVPVAATVAAPDPRTPAEVENDRVIAEQMAIAEGGRKAEAMQRAAKQEWEAHRDKRPPRMDYSRYTF